MGTSRTIDFCPREAPNPGRLPPQASAIFVPSDNSRLYIVCNNYTSWHMPSQLYNLVKKSRIWILLGSPNAKKEDRTAGDSPENAVSVSYSVESALRRITDNSSGKVSLRRFQYFTNPKFGCKISNTRINRIKTMIDIRHQNSLAIHSSFFLIEFL